MSILEIWTSTLPWPKFHADLKGAKLVHTARINRVRSRCWQYDPNKPIKSPDEINVFGRKEGRSVVLKAQIQWFISIHIEIWNLVSLRFHMRRFRFTFETLFYYRKWWWHCPNTQRWQTRLQSPLWISSGLHHSAQHKQGPGLVISCAAAAKSAKYVYHMCPRNLPTSSILKKASEATPASQDQ